MYKYLLLFLACTGTLCKTCTGSASECTSCQSPRFLKDDACVEASDCDESTALYQNELTRICEGMAPIDNYLSLKMCV